MERRHPLAGHQLQMDEQCHPSSLFLEISYQAFDFSSCYNNLKTSLAKRFAIAPPVASPAPTIRATPFLVLVDINFPTSQLSLMHGGQINLYSLNSLAKTTDFSVID